MANSLAPALTMTRGVPSVMAEANVLPHRAEFQRVEMARLSNELAHPRIDAGAMLSKGPKV
jgi:hypothetical protein